MYLEYSVTDVAGVEVVGQRLEGTPKNLWRKAWMKTYPDENSGRKFHKIGERKELTFMTYIVEENVKYCINFDDNLKKKMCIFSI